MPPRALRSQKKQSRLQFSPLPSSSPSKEKYSDAIQDRLAIVRHDDAGRSPSAKSRLQIENGPGGLPTPEKSSQRRLSEHEQSISSPLSDPPSSIIDPFETLDHGDTVKLKSNLDITAAHGDRSSDATHNYESDDIPLPSSKRRKIQSGMKGQAKAEATPRRSTRLRPTQNLSSSGSQSPTPSSRVVAVVIPSPVSQASELGSAETSGDEDGVFASKPTARRRSQRPPKDDFVVDDNIYESYPSEEEIVTPSKSKRRLKASGDNFIVDDDRVEYISSDEEPTPSKKQKVARSHKSPRTPRTASRKERLELEEDLEDLQDSDAVVDTRTRRAPVNKAREETRKHLEILKRRRAGEKISLVSDDEEEPVEMSIHHRHYSLPPDEQSSADSELPPANANLDDYEDDFIEDDTSEQHGIHPDIPLEFTSYASRRPRELFIHVVDWLVKNKISPAFDRHDPLWTLAFNKLDDEVKAQAGSRLISSAWNAPFVRTLEARPGLKVVRLPGNEDDYIRTCDACNRTNHPAQFDFKFSGQAYIHKTLEPVDDDDDSEEDNDNNDDDDDAASMDSKKHLLQPTSQHFYLGRYCAANAEMGHRMSHWLFHLNQNLLTYLEEQGVLSADKVIARDRKNHKRREREAEEVVDAMRDTGVVDDLWQEFKNDLDDARVGMDGFEKKGGRSKGLVGSVRVQREDGEDVGGWRESDVREGRHREPPRVDESD